jgi:hypothetical protein
VATHLRTPRAMKKYLNRVRLFAMLQRVPEPTLMSWERLKNRMRGRRASPRYADEAIPDDVLVAITALDQCAPVLLDAEDTFTNFADRVAETLRDFDPAIARHGDKNFRYRDSIPIAYREIYRRLAGSIPLR